MINIKDLHIDSIVSLQFGEDGPIDWIEDPAVFAERILKSPGVNKDLIYGAIIGGGFKTLLTEHYEDCGLSKELAKLLYESFLEIRVRGENGYYGSDTFENTFDSDGSTWTITIPEERMAGVEQHI